LWKCTPTYRSNMGTDKNRKQHKKTAKALYTCVSCNRWKIKDLLGIGINLNRNEEDPILLQDPESTEEVCVSSDIEKSQESKDEEFEPEDKTIVDHPTSGFKIFIPREKWKIIHPQERIYNRKDIQRQNQRRQYMVLKPGIWADVFNSLVWESVKWPCSWSFKGNSIYNTDEAIVWLVIRASCACGNKMRITSKNEIAHDPTTNVELDVNLWGSIDNHSNFKDKHIRKRPYAGEKTKETRRRDACKKH